MAYWNVDFNPRIDINDSELNHYLCYIEAQRIALSNIPLPPGIRKKFDAVNVTNQIKASTRIEGSQLSDSEVEEAIKKVHSESQEEQEIIAAKNLHEYIVKNAPKDPNVLIDETLIRKFHYIITKGIDDSDYIPGEYRKTDLVVGKGHKPTAFEQVPTKMTEFINFINSEQALSMGGLIRAVVSHFYLVSIHPFQNGNGRTSRALEAYILYCGGYNQLGFYSLSNFYYKNYKQYFEELDNARFKYGGNLKHFVMFALKGFLEEVTKISSDAYSFVKAAMYKDYLEECCLDSKINKRAYGIAWYILNGHLSISKNRINSGGDPFFNSLLEKVSLKTIQRDIKQLTDNKLLKWDNDMLSVNIDIMNQFT